MTTALDHIGDLRAATTDLERAHVLLSSRHMPRWVDLRAYAEGYDRDVLSVARLVQWSTVTDAYGRTDLYGGALEVAGVELDVPAMGTVTRRWSTRPGWYVLDLWESDAWVRSVDGAPHRDAPRRCLEAVDAYHRGKATIDRVLSTRRVAAYAANSAAACAATYAAYAATAATYAAAYAAAYTPYAVAIADAPHIRDVVAVAVEASDVVTGSTHAQERARWHTDWRWHLVHAALGGTPK